MGQEFKEAIEYKFEQITGADSHAVSLQDRRDHTRVTDVEWKKFLGTDGKLGSSKCCPKDKDIKNAAYQDTMDEDLLHEVGNDFGTCSIQARKALVSTEESFSILNYKVIFPEDFVEEIKQELAAMSSQYI